MLPVCVDIPRSDSPQPCGQPKQRFRDQLEAGPGFDMDSPRFEQSIFGATSTEFPWRSLPPAAGLAASCVALAANHRRWSLLNLRRRSPTCCRRTRFSSIRYAMTFCWCWLIQPAIVVSQHNHLNEIEFLNTTGLLENLGPGKCDHRVHDAAGWPNSLAGRTEEDFLVKRI